MVKLLLISVPLITLQWTTLAQEHTATDSTRSISVEFPQLASKWKEAYNSKDARNFVPLYADSAEYISAHVDGYIAHGRDAIIANFQRGMDMGGAIDTIEILSTTFSSELATVVSRYKGTAGGRNVDGRNLIVWKRIKGTWRILTHMTVVRD